MRGDAGLLPSASLVDASGKASACRAGAFSLSGGGDMRTSVGDAVERDDGHMSSRRRSWWASADREFTGSSRIFRDAQKTRSKLRKYWCAILGLNQ